MQEEKPLDTEIEPEGQDAEIVEGEAGNEGQAKDERPAKNVQAELDRKTREIEELRGRIDRATSGYNPNDLSTWDDKQLYALRAAPDVKPEFKMQAEDILMDRKVERRMAHEREREVRQTFEQRRIDEFPETLDPGSPLSARMNKIAREYRLDSTPSGLYAAARIAAGEMKKPTKDAKREASAEKERVAAIKTQKTSGDLPKRGDSSHNRTYEETLKKAAYNDDAFFDALRAKGGGTFKGVLKPL